MSENNLIPSTSFYELSLKEHADVKTASNLGVALNGSASFTITSWVKFTGLSAENMILTNGNDFLFGVNETEIFFMMANYPYITSDSKISQVSTSEWHYVAITYNQTSVSIYIDGELNSQQIINGTPKTSSDAFLIGKSLQARMRNLTIYNVELNSDQVSEAMFSETPPSGIVANFDFTQKTPKDIGPSNYPVTLENGASMELKTPVLQINGASYAQPINDVTVNPGGEGPFEPYSVQAWVKLDGTGLNNTIFCNGDISLNSGMSLYMTYNSSTKDYSVYAAHGDSNNPTNVLKSTSTVSTDKWYNIGCTFDGAGTLKLYINGNLDASLANVENTLRKYTGTPLIGSSKLGGVPTGINAFQGVISVIDVWDIELDQTQIQTNMGQITEGSDGQVAHYNFLVEPLHNTISGAPVGLTGTASVEAETNDATGFADFVESKPEQMVAIPVLMDATISKFRSQAQQSTEAFLSKNPNYFEEALQADLNPALLSFAIPEDQWEDYKKRMTESWQAAKSKTQSGEFVMKSFMMVHEHEDRHYLMLHGQESSRCLCELDIETTTSCVLWKVNVILIVVSGILAIFGIEALVNRAAGITYIQNFVLRNRNFMIQAAAILNAGIKAASIFRLISIFYNEGLLWPLIKIFLASLGWWALARVLVKIFAWLFPAAGAAMTVASLVETAVHLAIAFHNVPVGCGFFLATPPQNKDWMKTLSPTTTIDNINLPGTHDTAAINGNFRTPYACHFYSTTDQLNGGIRLLDIRLKVKKTIGGSYYFNTCHSDHGLYLNINEYQSFTSLMDECKDFLTANSSEAIVMSLKFDDWNGYGSDSTAVLNALKSVLANYPVYTQAATSGLPTLSTVKGKIVLINRINTDNDLGIPISVPDNTVGTLSSIGASGASLYIQDKYNELTSANTNQYKLGLVTNAFNQKVANRVVFNFASAVHGGINGVYIMGDLLGYFGKDAAAQRPSKFGWVLFDYQFTSYSTSKYGNLNIVQMIINSNFGYNVYPDAFTVQT
ncbi:MAG: hypothetical protein JJ971_09235 [Balneolaceae bacterium]|nr:hypothetical protein [Balneolaceae bacterium]MBO6546573.1 hypothetical protein [Balneolaceae bacterium]MBO6648932.1 hypothetical protein [Balneolaceae bacterium]